jgi:hypothetical protein
VEYWRNLLAMLYANYLKVEVKKDDREKEET